MRVVQVVPTEYTYCNGTEVYDNCIYGCIVQTKHNVKDYNTPGAYFYTHVVFVCKCPCLGLHRKGTNHRMKETCIYLIHIYKYVTILMSSFVAW